MAGNAKFDVSSVGPDDPGFSGGYPNGQRVSYSGPSLDRSGSFREVSDGRSFSSGPGTSKSNASAMTDLPHLNLDPITMGDPKPIRLGELRRALGVINFGNVVEDNAFAGSQSRPPTILNTDEIKRFRSSVLEGSLKARSRVKRFDDLLNKLNKYYEVGNSKKQHTNERSGGSNLLKMGSQSHRISPELAAQKLEDRNKNIALNKRARTPMGDLRAEGRVNGSPRQHLVLGKDKGSAKEGNFEVGEEKIRRLPAGGEGWDKKMKRKRSRPLDGDGELKRTMHGRLGNDSSINTLDGHGFRSVSPSFLSGSNKVDGSPSSTSLSGRITPKNESEKTSLSRELVGMNKERVIPKGNIKLNMREEPHLFNPSSITKGKASRAHRGGPGSAGNSSPNFSRVSGTPEDWEQPLNVNKVHSLAGVNNRKRPLPTDSSSPPMAQWVGQRPQKISRNRRTNIVSPASNSDEVQIPVEECTTPDFSTRISGGMNGSVPVRNIMSSSQQLKAKLETVQSPARLSENEENSGFENRLKDKVLGGIDIDDKGTIDHQNARPSGSFTKKSKLLGKDEIGDSVRRQNRSGRGPSFPKGSISPLREKPESPAIAKPARSTRPGSEKNGSKSGRPPLKKHTERKGFRRPGSVLNSSSPDFTAESDDDREEILAAALFACNASYNGCSSSFWERLEPIFYLHVEEKTFLEKQLIDIENHQSNSCQMLVLNDNMMNHMSQPEKCWPHISVPAQSTDCILTESIKTGGLVSQYQDQDSSYRGLDSEKSPDNITPLYHRVLSALIVEDDFEESKDIHFLSDSPSMVIKNDYYGADRIYCNGSASQNRFSSTQVSTYEKIEEGNYSLQHSNGQGGPRLYQNEVNGSLPTSIHTSCSASLVCEYDQMCLDDKLLLELQSIGLYPDTVPDLAEGEDELINEDIAQLEKQLSEQAGKKKVYFERIHQAIQKKGAPERDLEKVAVDRLVELAFRKLLATRGNYAVKIGISKVSRHVALAFIKRTLARCRRYEEAGKSCFSEPAVRDILLAVPGTNAGAAAGIQADQRLEARSSGRYPDGSEQLNNLQNDKSERSMLDTFEPLSQSDHAFARNGPILNRGKKKEVLLDDVGGNGSLRATSSLGSTLPGGAKGKRSDRDSGPKAGRPSLSNSKGERKTKSKPKQKVSQLSIHPVQPTTSVSGEFVNNASNRRREGQKSPRNIPDSLKESNDAMDLGRLPLSELDSIEDLNVANELEGHQDLSSWLNFDEVEGLQDDDGFGGLQIPMDDLSDLNMLL